MPIDVSRALDTTTGKPIRSAISQAGSHPTERLHLEHSDVRCFALRYLIGICSPPDRLVGSDRHMQSRSGQPSPQVGELVDAAHRAARHTQDRIDSSSRTACSASSTVQPPLASILIFPVRAQRVADGLQPSDILGQRLTSLSDLHLGGLAAGSPGDLVRLLRARRPESCC